jgi:transcriptional regulator with PAS, ATPase and Fis domain
MVLSPITVVLGSLLIIEILSAKNTSYERVIIGQKRTKLDNDRITALVNNLRDAVISTDKDGGINLYNSAVLNILDTNTPITQKNIGDVFDIESVNGDKLNLLDELKRSTSTNYRDDIVMSVDKGDNIRLGITTVPIQSGYSLEPTGYLAIISDITKSKSLEEVRDEVELSKVNFRQEKTDGVEYLYISKQARDLLGDRQAPQERVFRGLKYGMTYNTEIIRWCNRAAVPKHITFHSARHTNAVLLLENGADIYTVSKRLGHRELRTTQIYAKIVDSKAREAAEMIPELNIEI